MYYIVIYSTVVILNGRMKNLGAIVGARQYSRFRLPWFTRARVAWEVVQILPLEKISAILAKLRIPRLWIDLIRNKSIKTNSFKDTGSINLRKVGHSNRLRRFSPVFIISKFIQLPTFEPFHFKIYITLQV